MQTDTNISRRLDGDRNFFTGALETEGSLQGASFLFPVLECGSGTNLVPARMAGGTCHAKGHRGPIP